MRRRGRPLGTLRPRMKEPVPEKQNQMVRAMIRALKFSAILIMFLEFVFHCLHPVTLFLASTAFLVAVFSVVVFSLARIND
jgi:hypothetical protein